MSTAVSMMQPVNQAPHPWLDGPLKATPRNAPGRGRGLFATAPIAAGEVIDRACSIPLTSDQCDQLESILPLGDFYFRHPEDPERGLVLLGLVSVVNYAEEPNAGIQFVHCEDLGWVGELVCLQPIANGEEITFRYRCEPWFDVR